MKKFLLLILLLLPLIGWASLFDWATPTKIPEGPLNYGGYTNGPPRSLLKKWSNRNDLQEVMEQVDLNYKLNDLDIRTMSQRNNILYASYSDQFLRANAASLQLQNQLFGQSGAVAMGLGALGLGGGTLFGWLACKRPRDKTPKEHESEIKRVGNLDPHTFRTQNST